MAKATKTKEKAPTDFLSAIGKIKEKYNFKTTQFLNTGSVILDSVLVQDGISDIKGLPLGKFIEFYGDTGCGKSTIVLQACKVACALGYYCVYLDVEGGVNESQLDGIGLTPYMEKGLFHVIPVNTFEEAEEVILGLMEAGNIAYIVIDSITALLPGVLQEESIGEVRPGIHARYTSLFMQKFKPVAKEKNITFLFINQMRTKLNFKGVSSQDSAGGSAQKFYQDIRIYMRTSKKLERVAETINGRETIQIGSETTIVAKKNRYNKPFVEGNAYVIFGKGISNIQSYTDWLINNDIVYQKGSWYYIEFKDYEKVSLQGINKVNAWVKAHSKEVREYIDANGGFLLVKPSSTEDDIF